MEGPKTELIASPVRELDSYPSDREEEPDLRERDPTPVVYPAYPAYPVPRLAFLPNPAESVG